VQVEEEPPDPLSMALTEMSRAVNALLVDYACSDETMDYDASSPCQGEPEECSLVVAGNATIEVPNLQEKCDEPLQEKCDEPLQKKCDEPLQEKCDEPIQEKCDERLPDQCDERSPDQCDEPLSEKRDVLTINICEDLPKVKALCDQADASDICNVIQNNLEQETYPDTAQKDLDALSQNQLGAIYRQLSTAREEILLHNEKATRSAQFQHKVSDGMIGAINKQLEHVREQLKLHFMQVSPLGGLHEGS